MNKSTLISDSTSSQIVLLHFALFILLPAATLSLTSKTGQCVCPTLYIYSMTIWTRPRNESFKLITNANIALYNLNHSTNAWPLKKMASRYLIRGRCNWYIWRPNAYFDKGEKDGNKNVHETG